MTKASTRSKRIKGLLQEWFGNTGTIGKDDKKREKGHQGRTTSIRRIKLQSHLRRTTSSLKKASKRETCTDISLGCNHYVL